MNLRSAIFICTLFCCLEGCRSKDASTLNNRLAHASSPYLREHADNPVDWYEWGDEALGRAQREGKPLIISVGYAACHWCHVMEAETFMDTAVARIMNENFISIKVDREERPDIDQIYINAAQLISGNAGWPLNVFALPDGRPFFAATYFPKEQWMQMLKRVADTYQNNEQTLRKQAASITQGVRNETLLLMDTDSVAATGSPKQDVFGSWIPYVDVRRGGLSGAPKFPMPVIWEFMLQHYRITGSEVALQPVLATLDGMSHGGIYDHLRGGFARYATDSLWHIPHFEKMLYDNAQLVKLYAQGFQLTQEPQYESVVRETLDFVKKELTSDDGLFYSSINADSEGEEGAFYVWTPQEINDILGKGKAALFLKTFNVTASGNWEGGKNVLYRDAVHSDQDQESAKQLADARHTLLSVRNRRTRPSTDDKIITSWNALMIEGYLQAFEAFGDAEYREAALRAARAIQKDRLDKTGHLWRTYEADHLSIDGFLDDYALLCRAFIKLYQVTFDLNYLTTARLLADYVIAHFGDEHSGLFYYSLDRSAQQIARKIDVADEVIPSSNAVFAEALYLLGEYYQHEPYVRAYDKMITTISGRLPGVGPYYASWARLKEFDESKPYEVAIVGPEAVDKRSQLMTAYLPTVILCGGQDENLPLLENKKVEGKTMIYVCRNRVCKFPVEDVNEALNQLR